MRSQLDWWEQKFQVDRRARRAARLKTRRNEIPFDKPIPHARDQPHGPLAILKAHARYLEPPVGAGPGYVMLRPELKILRHLAFHCCDRTNILDDFEASKHADALVALCAHWRDWLRPLDDWQPPQGDTRVQFGSLVRHLLAYYEVPSFLDEAWRTGLTSDGMIQQNWFKLIGRGENIRTADGLPIALTKRMSYYFLQAPHDIGIVASFRYAQVRGMGGDERLARSLVATRLGSSFRDEDFWETVIRWLIEHPDVEPVHHGPIIDYVHNQKFILSVPSGLGRGHPRLVAPQPNLCMKGRRTDALLRAIERWRRRLSAVRGPVTSWQPSGIPSFSFVDQLERKTYAITELISSSELEEEGAAMNHCVATYRPLCQSGQSSIWSLSVEDAVGKVDRLLTLEVRNWGRLIIQARGRFNRVPEPDELRILSLWASVGGPCLSQGVWLTVE